MREPGRKDVPPLESADRLHALSLDDWTFVARMTGPFVDILKNVALHRLQVSFVEIAFRASPSAISAIRTAVARYSFTRSSE